MNTDPRLLTVTGVLEKPTTVTTFDAQGRQFWHRIKEPGEPDASGVSRNRHRCLVCGVPDSDKPMIFKGTAWCCETHRKVVQDFDYCQRWPDLYHTMFTGILIRSGDGPVALLPIGEAPVPERLVFRS